jgi:hypothetical protein
MEFGSCDYFSEFLHVSGLDVNNVEALVLNVEVPKVDSQIIAADKGFPVTVHRDAVNVIGVRVGVCSAWHGGNDRVVVCESRQFQVGSVLELMSRQRFRSATTASNTPRCDIVGEIVLRYDLERLLEDFP